MLKLSIEDDEGKTTVVPLTRDEMTVGRQEGNTIRLTERNVSRRHARLSRQNGTLCIEDLSSFTGVRVNGTKIVSPTPLREGDEVQIGDYRIIAAGRPPAGHRSTDDADDAGRERADWLRRRRRRDPDARVRRGDGGATGARRRECGRSCAALAHEDVPAEADDGDAAGRRRRSPPRPARRRTAGAGGGGAGGRGAADDSVARSGGPGAGSRCRRRTARAPGRHDDGPRRSRAGAGQGVAGHRTHRRERRRLEPPVDLAPPRQARTRRRSLHDRRPAERERRSRQRRGLRTHRAEPRRRAGAGARQAAVRRSPGAVRVRRPGGAPRVARPARCWRWAGARWPPSAVVALLWHRGGHRAAEVRPAPVVAAAPVAPPPEPAAAPPRRRPRPRRRCARDARRAAGGRQGSGVGRGLGGCGDGAGQDRRRRRGRGCSS